MLMLKIDAILTALAHRRRSTSTPAITRELDDRIEFAATHSAKHTLLRMGTTESGLNADDLCAAREMYGPNEIVRPHENTLIKRLASAFINPFTGILAALALVSLYTDVILAPAGSADPSTALIIAVMVGISGTLHFTQETKSGNAAAALRQMVTATCSVLRPEGSIEVAHSELVPGDIIQLAAGDMIPADARVIQAKDLFVNQSALTGESISVEKTTEVVPLVVPSNPSVSLSLSDCTNIVFTGTTVASGSGRAVVLATGNNTCLGKMAAVLDAHDPATSFDEGVAGVSKVLVRFMLVMVPIVFVVNALTKHDWLDALLFSISVAVGITPQMLPVIVTTSLSRGATALSRQKVIVKNLSAIQNLGSMDVLCCDKTGTLTEDHVVLERHLNVEGDHDTQVLRYAFLNSWFQTGLKNLIDRAVIERADLLAGDHTDTLGGLRELYTKIDEVPFDFERRRMSVVVTNAAKQTLMITKGAVEEMLACCSHALIQNQRVALDEHLHSEILQRVSQLNARGLRVIAVATKDNPQPQGAFGVADESNMVLVGYLAFLDPPKESAARALRALAADGVATKVLTGDSDAVAAAVCRQVGLNADTLLTGQDIERMTDSELATQLETVQVLAKLSPLQKARIVRLLREQNNHVVGFMGDGINDAAAMRESDCGISVDTAVDIAKETADIILLQKDLGVLEHGVREGRRTYGNMIKYIKITASSNFGNVFSVLVASAFLPFLPMTALQLVLLSLIYEVVCVALPWDRVDPEFLARPRPWNAGSISTFMRWLGPTSSIFDIITFAVLFFIICPTATGTSWAHLTQAHDAAGMAAFISVFQTGWFIESMITQTLVVCTLRSPRLPFVQTHTAPALSILMVAGIAVAAALPFSPFASHLGLTPLPAVYIGWLVAILAGYLVVSNIVKTCYIRRYTELL